jgi:Histidine kinase
VPLQAAGPGASSSSAPRSILGTTLGWRPASTLVPATRGGRKRSLANVSDQVSPSTAASAAGSSLPTLAALRQARASREALLRRILPIGVGALVIVVVATSRAKPGAGLHGASLGVTLALAGFALAAVGGFAALLAHRTGARLLVSVLVLLMVSSSVLVWLQPDGAGPVGLLIAVGVAARIIPGRTSVLMLTACLGFLLIAESVSQNRQHRGTLELLVNALPLAAIYMIVLFGRRIRTQEAQAEQLLIELEESRGAELRAAALAERQRLARDMHDVLAHSLSGLLLQLEGPGCSRWPARPTSGWPGPSTAPTSWPRTVWTRRAGPSACSATTTCPARTGWPRSPRPSRPTPACPPGSARREPRGS